MFLTTMKQNPIWEESTDFLGNPPIESNEPNQIWYWINNFSFFKEKIKEKLKVFQNVKIELKSDSLTLFFPRNLSKEKVKQIVEQIGCIDNDSYNQNNYKTVTHLDQINVYFTKETLISKNIDFKSIHQNTFSVLTPIDNLKK